MPGGGDVHVFICMCMRVQCVFNCVSIGIFLWGKSTWTYRHRFLFTYKTLLTLYSLPPFYVLPEQHTHTEYTYTQHLPLVRPSLPCYKTPTNASLVGIDPATACCNVTQQHRLMWKEQQVPGACRSLSDYCLSFPICQSLCLCICFL